MFAITVLSHYLNVGSNICRMFDYLLRETGTKALCDPASREQYI